MTLGGQRGSEPPIGRDARLRFAAMTEPRRPSTPRSREGSWNDVSDPRGASGEQRAGRAAVQLQRTFPAVPQSVGAVRSALVAFAHGHGIAERIVDAVALAASEAATNVVLHAYAAAGAEGSIEVTAALAGTELWVIVTDAGSGLQPHRESPGLGLGLAIIARVADGVDLIELASGGLEVRMRFAVGPGDV